MEQKSPVDPIITLARRLTEELILDLEDTEISKEDIQASLEWIAIILEKGSVIVDGFISHRKALNRSSLRQVH